MFKKYLIIFSLFLLLLACMGNISAESIDVTDIVGSDMSLDNQDINIENENHLDETQDLALTCSDEDNAYEICNSESKQIISSSSSDEGYVIYVGHNNKTSTGNGTQENPFSTFQIACDEINNQNILYDKITLKIFEGNYTLGSILNFNAKNLDIWGNGTVIIKSVFNSASIPKGSVEAESFGLTSTDGNFTMTNIIFDASNRDTAYYKDDANRKCWFEPFHGLANSVVYDNCSFINYVSTSKNGYNGFTLYEYSTKFINCYFDIGKSNKKLFFNMGTGMVSFNKQGTIAPNAAYIFDYCWFNMPTTHHLVSAIYLPYNISITNSWFGQNSVGKTFFAEAIYNLDGSSNDNWSLPINRYVEFSVSENYLGNNQWEIIGKLTWNGTDNQDGMENFQPAIVTLTSDNGYKDTATLEKGTFRTIYNSTLSNNELTVTLGYQPIELEFNNVNISVIAPAIKYGEDQNITINFSQPINSTVSITVNNRTYSVKVNESDSVTYTINDVNLTKGEYNVDITLNDTEKHIYGSNSTTLSVSKVSVYTFNPVVPSEAKIGDTVNINVELPEDVTGNVTVYVNNNPITQQASKNTVISITDLVEGNNEIIVFYEGNNKYENKTSAKQYITADKVSDYSFDVILPSNVKVGDNPSITIKLPNDAKGNAIVYVGTQAGKSVPVTSGSTNVSISGLIAGNNSIKVVFSDNRYEEKTITKNLTVEKVSAYDFKVTLPTNVKVGDRANVVINLPDDASGNLTVYLGEVPFKDTANGNTISVPISGFVEGNNNISVVYEGNGKYVGKTFNGNITVTKVTDYSFDVTLPTGTIRVGDNPEIVINLPDDVNGSAIVYVGNQDGLIVPVTTNSTNVPISGLIAGNNTIKVVFTDKKYGEKTITKNLTVNKVNEYTFNVVLPTGVKMGDTANVVINLPDDASGNVTVYLGEVPFKDTANGNTISVPISGFVEGNNNISVVYEGNGKYVGKTFNGNISVDKKPVEITNNTIVVDTPKDTTTPSVSINLPENATGNLTVIVNGKTYTKELVNGSATITITDLPAGTYNATVLYTGDKVYDSINTTTTITVSEAKKQDTNTNTNTNTKKTTKVATKLIAKNKKFKAKTKVKKYTITLKTKAGKAVKKVQVTLKIKGKTYKAKTNAKGKATFKIKKLTKKGKHKAVIKFAGNKNYKACSKKVKITIKK